MYFSGVRIDFFRRAGFAADGDGGMLDVGGRSVIDDGAHHGSQRGRSRIGDHAADFMHRLGAHGVPCASCQDSTRRGRIKMPLLATAAKAITICNGVTEISWPNAIVGCVRALPFSIDSTRPLS